MNDPIKAARRFCRTAGWFGIAVLLPQLFMENKLGIDYPPAVTHPEFYYGFLGVALAWQYVFLILGKEPLAYHKFLVPAALEKFSFAASALTLFFVGKAPALVAVFGGIDLAFGLGFAYFYRRLSTLTM
jgi:hypothetical protein